MSPRYDVVTFDCYGTLVDWDAGISGAFGRAAAAAGRDIDRDALLAAYHEIEPRVQAEGFRSYRAVLEETARRAGRRCGWEMSAEQCGLLPGGIGDWPPFPDTVAALERLHGAGHRLGILSNVDRDLLESTLARLGSDFEVVVTAEDVRSYKPAPGHFREARRRIGPARWLHAAQSHFHDVVPAGEQGIPVAWINRKGERAGGPARPAFEFPSLAALAGWLCDLTPGTPASAPARRQRARNR